jgi:acyl-CoA thioesterase I
MISPRLTLYLVFLLMETNLCQAVISIACVGDSITYGVGVANPATQSYPAKLQQLLGTNYTVGNYGISGATLLKEGDMPYWNTSAFVVSHGRPTPPNTVIIMLGSNDSKPQNWAYGTNFYSEYAALVATYTNLSPTPRVLICTPPPVFNSGNYNINPDIVSSNISPLIRELGTNLDLQVIDMQLLVAGHGEWFPDYVHPNSQGTAVMAAIVYTALRGDTMNGVIPSLEIKAQTKNTVVLTWPANGAGWVLQSVPTLGGESAWTVVDQTAANDGNSILDTNSVINPSAMFRLWNPSR